MAYDACRAETVMFGGTTPLSGGASSQVSRETWTFDGKTWTPETGSTAFPAPRFGAGMAYSPYTGRSLLYGGTLTNDTGTGTPQADPTVWAWDGSQWLTDPGVNDATVLLPPFFGIATGMPVPRAYASFDFIGGFSLYGGTPGGITLPDSRTLGLTPPPAFPDHWLFVESSLFPTLNPPVCSNPVPIPPDDTAPILEEKEAVPELVNNEIHEIDRLRVLLGTPWPQANRNTHNYPRNPNPNYTPPPECPRRYDKEEVSNTHLATDSRRNRVYQFYVCDRDRGSGLDQQGNYTSLPAIARLLIQAYDGTSLKPAGSAMINISSSSFGESVASRLLHDADRGRFLWRDATNGAALLVISQDLIEKGVVPVTGKIDLAGTPVASGGTFFNHPETGRAKLLFTIQATYVPFTGDRTTSPPKLGQWDLEDRREDWRVDLAACIGSGSGAMRVEDRAYASCIVSGSGLNARYAVVRVPLATDSSVPGGERPETPEVFPGSTNVIGTWYDPQAERVIQSANPGSTTRVLYVFDGKTSRYVGRAGIMESQITEDSSSFGFDLETGRLYMLMPDSQSYSATKKLNEPGGLMVFDTRLTPIPQKVNFHQFSSPGWASIAVLPAGEGLPRRVFLRRGLYYTPSVYPGHPDYEAQAKATADGMPKYPAGNRVLLFDDMDYLVLADEMPIPKQPDLSSLDSLTIPVAEDPGKTEVTFDAEGSGYGLRLRVVGGVLNNEGSESQIPACLRPHREVIAGWVARARLSDIEVSARTLGLEVDQSTKTDLQSPVGACNPPMLGPSAFPAGSARDTVAGTLWPFYQGAQIQANQILGSGATAEAGEQNPATTDTYLAPLGLGTIEVGKDPSGKPTGANLSTTGTGWDHHFHAVECSGNTVPAPHDLGGIHADAVCNDSASKVSGTALARSAGSGSDTDTASFSIGEAYSNVAITREPNGRGVVVTATSIVKGLKLGPLSIDRIETKAVSWSNGRAPTDEELVAFGERATFTRHICGVHYPDGSIPGCISSGHQQTFMTEWNKRWGSNGRMSLPTPDLNYLNGSPGGYVAGVTKPLADEVEDQFFALDYNKEVPGIVFEFYPGGGPSSPGRKVLMLAGVRAIAALGVQCQFHLEYSKTKNDCIDRPDDLALDEYEEEEEFFEEEEYEEEEPGSGWTEIEAIDIPAESLGSKIGKFLGRLPVLRQLPIRDIGEAILAGAVWWLLGLPLFLASRRFALKFSMSP